MPGIKNTLTRVHVALAGAGSHRAMTFEEYLEFLDEYWALFGPLPARVASRSVYRLMRL